jgi:hypothetical protein
MIANETDYQGALRELESLQNWLETIRREVRPRPDLGLLSVRRKIARLHEELGEFEARVERPAVIKREPVEVP